MWDQASLIQILDFMGVPQEKASAFPARKLRSNATRGWTDEQRQQLECIYASLLQKYHSAPGVVII